MRYPDAAPASLPQRQARAGEELATPGPPTSPGAPTLTVSRHGRVRGCGAVARGWGTHAAPGRARSRQAPRARGPATRTDAPAARPRSAAPLPVVAPAGVPTPQPSPVSQQPGLPCLALPTPQQHPSQRQSSQQPGPLLSRYLARPIRPLHTCFLASIPPGLALLSSRADPEPQLRGTNLGNRWERAPRITQLPPGLED